MMDDDLIGNPIEQSDHHYPQDLPDNCAVAVETSILNQFIENDLTLEEATYFSYSAGWYEPGIGTMPHEVGNLLEAHGVGVHRVEQASIFDLASELQAGHLVIVGVDANDLASSDPLTRFFNDFAESLGLDSSDALPANHAVSVTGIDHSDPANPMVVLNDPGHLDGDGVMYPLDQFMDAWQNSEFYYMATDSPPPGLAGIENFDIGDFLGVGTTLIVSLSTGDPVLAISAGELVNELADSIDMDAILRSV